MGYSKEDFKTPVVETEFQIFERWWVEYVKTLNSRATLVWQEIAWAGWFARSEIDEGKQPTVFPRRKGE